MASFSFNRFAVSALTIALVSVSPVCAQARASNQPSSTAGRSQAAPIDLDTERAHCVQSCKPYW
jgi:hypothetical protein